MPKLALETRRRDQIDNDHNNYDGLADGQIAQAAALKRDYVGAIHRPTPPCLTYNCHGLTFASRRTWISSPGEVRKILTHDDYVQINSVSDVMPGDIVIYISNDGDIEHSGIVVEISPEGIVRNPRVLSKWGTAHEVIHRIADCPYVGSRIEYYRVMK